MTNTTKKYATGALPSPKDLRDYRIAAAPVQEMNLPSEFVLDHTKIKNQGLIGSCVAHSISEVIEASDGVRYSTGWIYGYRPANYYQGKGMYIAEALKTVNHLGAVENTAFNHNVEVPRAIELVNNNLETLTKLAENKKVLSYARLYSINEIKQALFNYRMPVVISIPVGPDSIELDEEFIAQIPKYRESGHALMCYGWNEKGFLIQNSWGTTWGNKGCFILPYEYDITEAWFLTLDKRDVRKPELFWVRVLIQKLINMLIKLLTEVH